MSGVVIGYLIIGGVIALGYVLERSAILGSDAGTTLNRFAFLVATPGLLFTVLADADVSVMFSGHLWVAMLSFLVAAMLYLLISALVFRRRILDTLIGTIGAAQVNSSNIGIPVAIYVLGGTEYAAPVLLFQVIMLTPLFLTLLDLASSGTFRAKNLLKPLTNPPIVASVAGTIVAFADIEIPEPVLEPLKMVGSAAIPLILISFGMSLYGRKPLAAGSPRAEILTATTIKILIMPVVAWLLGAFAFGLTGAELFAVIVMAALPSAQSIYTLAVQYNRSVILARDTLLLTTVLSFFAVMGIALLMGR